MPDVFVSRVKFVFFILDCFWHSKVCRQRRRRQKKKVREWERDQEAQKCGNKKRKKGKVRREKITPCFRCAKDFIIPNIYFTSLLLPLSMLKEEKKEKRGNFLAFPGSFSSFAHASFVDSTLQLLVVFH